MKIFELGDRLWERMKARSRRLQAADATDDQTHVHHALITVLLFGSIGTGMGLLGGLALEVGLRAGILGGLGFYAIRETLARWRNWSYKPWDGVCDVAVPLWVAMPVLLNSVVALWVMSLVVALLYFVFRPIPPVR